MQPTLLAAVPHAPFGLQLRPEDAVWHGSWHRACEDALAALRRGEPVAVLGLPGTGKTFMLQRLTQLLAGEGLRARRFEALQLTAPEDQHDILVVDEADRLPGSMLDRLCDQPGLFIMAGLPQIAQHLADQSRLVAIVTLEPLSPEDVARFIAARLSATGHKRDLFEPEAVLALTRHSAGLPRLIVTLGGAAMFLGAHEGCKHVTERHVDEAAAMRNIDDTQEAPSAGLALPSQQLAASAVLPTMVERKRQPRPVPFAWANRGSLGLAGAILLGALGWMLVPRHAPLSLQTLPQPEANLTSPAAPSTVGSPLADPVPIPAPEILPDAAPLVAVQRPAATPPPAPPRQLPATLAFQGPILNETMNQKGRLSLNIRRSGATGVTANFQASAGLIGSGDLTGTITPDGHITASGRLMMGRNPFDTTLTAIIVGDKLEGVAVFNRPDGSSLTRSRFSLLRP